VTQSTPTISNLTGSQSATAIGLQTETEIPKPSTPETSNSSTPTRRSTPQKDLLATEKAALLDQSPTLTPQSTKTPTQTATEVVFATLPPAQMSGLIWSDWINTPIVLEGFAGKWSPTYNEMVSFYPTDFRIGEKAIVLATAPDFSIRLVDLGDVTLYDEQITDEDITWSPDGRRILFGGPGIAEFQEGLTDYSDPWVMDRRGQNPHLVGEDLHYSSLQFSGWMDDRTVVMNGYGGGGHWSVEIVDYLSGKILAQVVIHGLIFGPNQHYLPAAEELGGRFSLVAISREPQVKPVPWLFESSEHIKLFPNDNIDEIGPFVSTIFKDWYPNSNQMLVYAFAQDSFTFDLEVAWLISWNVETDEVQFLFPNGVDGRFSPDGRSLAAITIGPPELDADNTFTKNSKPPLSQDQKPYLNIIDMIGGNVYISLPVVAPLEDDTLYIPYPNFQAAIAFSPDSHYLAFLAPGKVIVDGDGWPQEVEENGSIYMNVLDLQEMRLIHSISSDSQTPVWSPRSDYLAYRDEEHNWILIDIINGEVKAITESGGVQFVRVAWSHDGRYLSLYTLKEEFVNYIERTVVILIRP
jgi:hypothetical protein